MRKLISFLMSIISAGLTLICFLALFSFDRYDPSFFYDTTIITAPANILGIYGAHIAAFLLYMSGFSVLWLIPSFLLIAFKQNHYFSRIIGFLLFIPVTSSLASLFSVEFFPGIVPGGIIGIYTSKLLLACFGEEYRPIFLFFMLWALLIICLQLSFIKQLLRLMKKLPAIAHITRAINCTKQKLTMLFRGFTMRYHSIKPMSIADIQDDPFWQYYALVKKNQKK